MQKINFKIIFSEESELQRILWTKGRLEWYTNHNYNVSKLILPKDVTPEKLAALSEEEISEAVKKEFDPTIYQKHVQSIDSLLQKYLDILAEKFSAIDIEVLPNIEIRLTRYGMAGSYNIPNVAIVNISNFYDVGLIRNILHESIHLHVQPLIYKYGVDQWQKEVIVDGLFEKFFPDLFKKQTYPSDMSVVQNIFNSQYPNLDSIMSNVIISS
ncbi:MAG: hypothetical protein WCI52_03045 [bacterium]